MRKAVWKKYLVERYPVLSDVACRLLSLHPTSAATERNWSLWGRGYTAARSRLGIERAKKLMTFCFNDCAVVHDQDDFDLLLSVVKGEVDDVGSEASLLGGRPPQ
jgi:hypothetical protein